MSMNSPATPRSNAQASPAPAFIWPIRVYWEDTDAGGVVYHASYLRFLERARTEWLRVLGFAQEALREREGVVFVVRAMRLEFLRPAKLDDELGVELAVLQARRASLLLGQTIRRGDVRLLEAEVKVACVAATDFRPRVVPEALAARLDNPQGVRA
ncbi:MAG: tol-pal system-associated acyl-CoA thioesterase [Proteobacteria bacterium]|nr:tol-pal system-associated acyl-CoA thioesterase [Pseudomonadota bacterium]